MKKSVKVIISLLLAATLCFSFTGCAKVGYIVDGTVKAVKEVKSGEWKNAGQPAEGEAGTESADDPAVIDEFAPGTFGGIEFKTIDDVVKCYADAYNKTKAKKAMFIDEEGKKVEMYAFCDQKEITITDILVEGKSNAVINKLIPQLLNALYVPTIGGLQPCNAREPEKDVDENNESLMTCRVKADDLVTANVKDGGDGKIIITMQPKMVNMSRVGIDEQGRMFTSLNDIGAVVDAVDAFSWASGTTEENCKVVYKGGTAVITIDPAIGEIVEAHYDMHVYVNIVHANLSVVHDKSLSATVDYKCDFPCSKEFFDKVNVHPAG
ncbi:MAG: hypothetical protein K6C14_03655 [Eubacterium sp.]|nr:hypothetical protein [Eubacterium sp.]